MYRFALLFAVALCFIGSSLAVAGEHPRLFFSQDDIPALREKIKQEPWKSMVERLAKDADDTVWGSKSYDTAWQASMTGFMYVLTGDEAWATKSRKYTQEVINLGGWGKGNTKGLQLYMWNKHVAQAYDFCYSSRAWDDDFCKTVSQKLKQQSDLIHKSGGRGQNKSAASNWQGIRYASAGLGYLATDEDVSDKDLSAAFGRVKRYLDANLGNKAAPGWNHEGLGYMTYPMSFVGPFAIAYERIKNEDLRQRVPSLRTTWWTLTGGTALYRTVAHNTSGSEGVVGSHFDFTDDNNHSMGEGTYGLSFYFLPDDLIPGHVWMYDRMRGASGDKTWDNERAGVIYSILYHPGNASMKNPMEIKEWTALFQDNTGNGWNVFRNRYQDENDIVAAINLRLRQEGGHNGPDALSFRINAFGGPLAVGGGRYGSGNTYFRLQNTLYVENPGNKQPKTHRTTSKITKTDNTPQFNPDGSAALVAHMSTTNTGVSNHTRRWLADFSPASGAAGVFVVADTSDNGKFWQYVAVEGLNKITTEGNTFTVTGPNGSLKATVLYPANVSFNQGTLSRGSDFFFKGKRFDTNRWINFESNDGNHLVVMTLVPDGQKHPEVKSTAGASATERTLTIGKLTVTIDGDDITTGK